MSWQGATEDSDGSPDSDWETALGSSFGNLAFGKSSSESTPRESFSASKAGSPLHQAKVISTGSPTSSESPYGQSPAHADANRPQYVEPAAAISSLTSRSQGSRDEHSKLRSPGTLTDDCHLEQWYDLCL